MTTGPEQLAKVGSIRRSLAYVRQPHLFRRCVITALVVGTILSLINQGHIVSAGDATIGTWLRIGVNYIVPFIVANVGAIAGASPNEE